MIKSIHDALQEERDESCHHCATQTACREPMPHAGDNILVRCCLGHSDTHLGWKHCHGENNILCYLLRTPPVFFMNVWGVVIYRELV